MIILFIFHFWFELFVYGFSWDELNNSSEPNLSFFPNKTLDPYSKLDMDWSLLLAVSTIALKSSVIV